MVEWFHKSKLAWLALGGWVWGECQGKQVRRVLQESVLMSYQWGRNLLVDKSMENAEQLLWASHAERFLKISKSAQLATAKCSFNSLELITQQIT